MIIKMLVSFVVLVALAACITSVDESLPYDELPTVNVATEFRQVASPSHPTSYITDEPVPAGAKVQVIGMDENAAWLLVLHENILGWMPTFYSRDNIATIQTAVVFEPLNDRCTTYLDSLFDPDKSWSSNIDGAATVVGSIYRPSVQSAFEPAQLVLKIDGNGAVINSDYIHTSLADESAIVFFGFSVVGLEKSSNVYFEFVNESKETLYFQAALFADKCQTEQAMLPIGKTKVTWREQESNTNIETPAVSNTPIQTRGVDPVPTVVINVKQGIQESSILSENIYVSTEATICSSEVIWQIGVFDSPDASASEGFDEFVSKPVYTEEYRYNVDANPDNETTSPEFPGVLFDQAQNVTMLTAKKVNVEFALNKTYSDTVLAYSRYGSEINDIYLDDQLAVSTQGPGEGIYALYEIPLGVLTKGEHVISLQYWGGGDDNGNNIDALSLRGSLAIGEAQYTTLRQIGIFEGAVAPVHGADEFIQDLGYVSSYRYNLTSNRDGEITAPEMPGLMYTKNTFQQLTSEAIEIAVDFERTYDNVVFRLSRYGSEFHDIYLDGTLLDTAKGPGENLHGIFDTSLGKISGEHTVTVKYAGGGNNSGNFIDAMGFCIQMSKNDFD